MQVGNVSPYEMDSYIMQYRYLQHECDRKCCSQALKLKMRLRVQERLHCLHLFNLKTQPPLIIIFLPSIWPWRRNAPLYDDSWCL